MAVPRWEDRSIFGKLLAIFATLVVALIGFLIHTGQESNRKAERDSFLEDKFKVIVVYEDDAKKRDEIVETAKKKIEITKPTTVFNEDTGPRELWRVDGLFIQRTPPVINGGFDNWGVILTVIKAPDATKKLRKWAQDSGYPNWNFEVRWDDQYHQVTQDVQFDKPGSKATIIAFYETTNRLILWDGHEVFDVSAGLTSNVGGAKGEKHYREYVRWLEGLSP